MEPLVFVPLLLLNLADAKNPSGTSGPGSLRQL